MTDRVTPAQIAELERENAALHKRDKERDRELVALREELAKVRKEMGADRSRRPEEM